MPECVPGRQIPGFWPLRIFRPFAEVAGSPLAGEVCWLGLGPTAGQVLVHTSRSQLPWNLQTSLAAGRMVGENANQVHGENQYS